MIRRTHRLIRGIAATAAILLAVGPLAASADAVIQPGDQLAIAVYGDATLTQATIVQPDGTIQYPLIGRVPLAGKTAAEARDTLANAFSKYVKNPSVTVSVTQPGSINVLVLGNVKTPGKYPVRSGARLSDAVAAASGIGTSNGDYPSARISQPDGTIANVSLQKLLRDGDATQNVPLQDNSIVYVTGADIIRVQVLGAVVRPGNVEVNSGDRLSMALARAGAEAGAQPDLNHVYLTRKDPTTGKNTSYQIDMYQALEHGDQRFDPVLQKDDTVYIPTAKTVNPFLRGVLGLIGRFAGL